MDLFGICHLHVVELEVNNAGVVWMDNVKFSKDIRWFLIGFNIEDYLAGYMDGYFAHRFAGLD